MYWPLSSSGLVAINGLADGAEGLGDERTALAEEVRLTLLLAFVIGRAFAGAFAAVAFFLRPAFLTTFFATDFLETSFFLPEAFFFAFATVVVVFLAADFLRTGRTFFADFAVLFLLLFFAIFLATGSFLSPLPFALVTFCQTRSCESRICEYRSQK